MQLRVLSPDETLISEQPMEYAGEVSTFRGVLRLPEPGRYIVEVVAAQPEAQDFGMDQVTVEVE